MSDGNLTDGADYHARHPLFVSDRQLRDLVAPHIGFASFRSLMQALEPKVFPRVNALFRARYYPAVRAWLDQHYGVVSHGMTMAEDGEETWDPPPKRGGGKEKPKRSTLA